MKEQKHPAVMVDIENFGTDKVNRIIVSVAAVKFNPYRDELTNDILADSSRIFYAVLDQDEQFARGMLIEPSCLDWWHGLPSDTQAVLREQREPVQHFLARFTKFVHTSEELWANDASFDVVRLSYLYQLFGDKWPLPYWKNRCCRTAKGYSGGARVGSGPTAHNALADAAAQIYAVQQHTRLAVDHITSSRQLVAEQDEAELRAAEVAARTFVGPPEPPPPAPSGWSLVASSSTDLEAGC